MIQAAANLRESGGPVPRKPKALTRGSQIATFAPASPASDEKINAGLAELERLGFSAKMPAKRTSETFFAASSEERYLDLAGGLKNKQVQGLVATRGGYGSNYLLQASSHQFAHDPKVIFGFSDITSLQIWFWQEHAWITFYGPMVAGGFDAGAGKPNGYDEDSFQLAVSRTDKGWMIPLQGDALNKGEAEGRLLGGCLTLVQTTLGTPWELDTREAILVLEDRAMKPWQVDRALMHLKQAGKLEGIRGMLLGEFPECEPPVAGSPNVRDVCERILGPLGLPIVFGAPIGHTPRPMLTLPLGVKARLISKGEGVLEILEPAVVP